MTVFYLKCVSGMSEGGSFSQKLSPFARKLKSKGVPFYTFLDSHTPYRYLAPIESNIPI